MYYLQIISLDNCPYSIAANELVNTNTINSKITQVNHQTKDNFKSKYITTFPQVYLKKQNSTGSLLLGGYEELKYYFDLVKNNRNIDTLKDSIKKYNKNLSDKATLRLIQLLI